jgi:hypothetical protein
MKGAVPILAGILAAFAPGLQGAQPCRTPELGRVHVPAFALAAPPGPSVGGSSEMEMQTRCLAWESGVTPKAEFDTGALLPYRQPASTVVVTRRVGSKAGPADGAEADGSAAEPLILDPSFLNLKAPPGGLLPSPRR